MRTDLGRNLVKREAEERKLMDGDQNNHCENYLIRLYLQKDRRTKRLRPFGVSLICDIVGHIRNREETVSGLAFKT